ncbi:MAG TPA: DUF6544 family protein [Candidatus Eisenbacteria bacterium]|nr:DUF6544 family protein [Candidatus Eisenbacteria bacterium]
MLHPEWNSTSVLELPGAGPRVTVTDAELAGLPDAVRRYLRFMRVPGTRRDRSLAMSWSGRFRLHPRSAWRTCSVRQSNTSQPVTRAFHIRMPASGRWFVTGDDTYARGRGRMRVRLFGRFPLADATGPELDMGELVTWLDDALLFAPSMLLAAPVTWLPVGGSAFDVTLEDAGQRVTVRVTCDAHGAPLEVSTTDRFVRDPYARGAPWVRARWTTPVDGWAIVHNRPRPIGTRAVWHLPQGEFCYVEMDTSSAILEYDADRGSGGLP